MHLKLKNCLLAGFSLGAIIAIRMLELQASSEFKTGPATSSPPISAPHSPPDGGSEMRANWGSPTRVTRFSKFKEIQHLLPTHVMLVAGIYDTDLFRIPLRFRFAIEIIKRVNPNNPIIYNMAYYCLHSRRFLNWFLTMVYRQEPDFEKVVEHQIELTLNMDTRAWLELAHDIFNLHFSCENLRFNIPATLVNNLSDDILDGKKTTEGFLKMFPKGKNFNLTLPRHSPKGPIDIKFVSRLLTPLVPHLKKLAS